MTTTDTPTRRPDVHRGRSFFLVSLAVLLGVVLVTFVTLGAVARSVAEPDREVVRQSIMENLGLPEPLLERLGDLERFAEIADRLRSDVADHQRPTLVRGIVVATAVSVSAAIAGAWLLTTRSRRHGAPLDPSSSNDPGSLQ